MKKLLIQLLIFFTPIIIILVVPVYVLLQSKENFNSIDNTVASNSKYLIGYAYEGNENNYGYLKPLYLNSHNRKNVWALGSSRVLQFREKMFDSSFYNAGYTVQRIGEFYAFLQDIPAEKYPKYIIIGLDQWMFNHSWDSLKGPLPKFWRNDFNKYPLKQLYKTVYDDLLAHKYTLSSIQNKQPLERIGLNAVAYNTGFRNDGSLYYGQQITKLLAKDTTAKDYKYSETFERISKQKPRFEYGDSVNSAAIGVLNTFLGFCKEKGIEVVAFLPPYSDEIYNNMLESHHYKFLNGIYNDVKPIFDHYKYEFYDFSTVKLCDSNDAETIDGFHASEITYQKILIKILHAGSVLNRVTSEKRLVNDLINRFNNYLVYDY